MRIKNPLPIEFNQNDFETLISSEINRYKSVPSIPHKVNPLDWWKGNENIYPNISQLARKVLSIPSTSAVSERVFSSGGRLITKLRSRLSTDNAADLIFLKGSWDSVENYLHEKEFKDHQSKKQRK